MYLAINRDSGLFNKETTDQINVKINAIDKNYRLTSKTREHYYDNVDALPISFKMPMENDASMKYGKVMIVNFSFTVKAEDEIAEISGYEQPFEVYCKAADGDGNTALVAITKKGKIRFATKDHRLYQSASIYCVIVGT